MTKEKQYKNPSLKEAICEIRYNASSSDPDWAKKIPHKLSSVLSDDYPLFEVLDESLVQFEIGNKLLSPIIHRFQYSSENKKHFITVKENTFSFSIKPYKDEQYCWESYHKKLCEEWDRLKNILEVESITRIGMRFVNSLEIESSLKPIMLLDSESKYIPRGILEHSNKFFNKAEFSLNEDNRFIIYFVYRDTSNKDKKELILDIDRIKEKDDISSDDISKITTDIHSDIEKVFLVFIKRAMLSVILLI